MRCGDRDHHARLAERDAADAVLGGRRLESVPPHALVEDRREPLLGHLAVGLVLEPADVPGHTLERSRSRRGVRQALGQRRDGERVVGDAHVERCATRTAAHRRDQGELVTGRERRRLGRYVGFPGLSRTPQNSSSTPSSEAASRT